VNKFSVGEAVALLSFIGRQDVGVVTKLHTEWDHYYLVAFDDGIEEWWWADFMRSANVEDIER
jgi:hypothetical protein